ncbi:FAD-dependent monooxygenase yanF [Colletotrichum trifolii]|uniref:FAD-dependent monooxygenase yanF n=1 Tax=Colletotrichum trifolii TaxID=5466 RepID=A0A4R8QTU2_COLTR|nr:FAD-dependent monooxygenase yanF [Colletotrichum trifolii]
MKFAIAPVILVLSVFTIESLAESLPECLCCSILAREPRLQGKVLAPGTGAYDARLGSYYSANAALAPRCMVMPTDTPDVARIAELISKYRCPFGMRSGAHSAWKGSNGCGTGVTVDFGHMNTTIYDERRRIASVQPGAVWESVFTALRPYNVTAVGGRASVVGVGGFITGGGYSFHTSAHGFACDSVANFEIVLANGVVVNANARENPDLWKAQKGGSGNLGFVTRVDLYVVNSTDMWGGLVGYDSSQRDALFEAYINFADDAETDPASQNIVASYFDKTGHGHRAILTNVDGREEPPAFNGYMLLRNKSSTLRKGPVAEIVPEFTGVTPLGLYANWIVGQFRSDMRVMKFIDDKLQEYGSKMQTAVPGCEFEMLLQFQPFTQNMVNHSIANGGNILGLERVLADGPTSNWLLALTVDKEANQDTLLPMALEFRDEVNAYAKEMGMFKEWSYLNYAYADQNPIATYGEENVALLRAVAAKVDPNGVFQRLRTTGFKLPA